MEREVLLEDLKKLYSSSDMVKAECGGCKGCHDCCCGMGDSIVLDPYDIYQMNKHLGVKFEELLNHKISRHAEEGLILPNLKMQGKLKRNLLVESEKAFVGTVCVDMGFFLWNGFSPSGILL